MLPALVYFVLLGGTPIGDTSGALLLINTLVGAAFVWAYFRRIGVENDLVDQLALAAFVVFLVTCLASSMLRQSFDVALSALALLAVFYVARHELPDPGARRWVLATLAAIALVVGIAAIVSWGGRWAMWLAELGLPPPRESGFSGLVFGHRHDVALLIGICVPAAVGWPGRRGVLFSILTVGVVGAAIFLEGSRNAWLAALVATAAVLAPPAFRRLRSRPLTRWSLAVLIGATVAVVALGFATGLWERMISVNTLGARINLWLASLEAWRQAPLTGLGPGTFPWALARTDYPMASGYVARHPDGAVPQLLAESGILGIVVVGLGLAAIVVGLIRNPKLDRRALWALVFFASACLFSNPSDFGFLVVPATIWAALATPPGAGRIQPFAEPAAGHPLVGSRARFVLGGVILVPALAVAIASVVHDLAADRASEPPAEAERLLRWAAALDPGMALYSRELGVALLLRGENEQAESVLQHATSLNPYDAVAWRALAEARLALGDAAGALATAAEAHDLAPGSPATGLTFARTAAANGRQNEAGDLETLVVAQNPSLLASDLADMGLPLSNEQALANALALWSGGEPIPGGIAFQPAWLVGLAGGDDLLPEAEGAAAEGVGNPAAANVARLIYLTLSCQREAALGYARDLELDMAGFPAYWEMRYLLERQSGTVSRLTVLLGTDMSPSIGQAEGSYMPQHDLVAMMVDGWGYGRAPMGPTSAPSVLPTIANLKAVWMRDARGTAASGMPGIPLAACGADDDLGLRRGPDI